MGKIVDYYFSTKSPWSYLGHARFVDIAKKHGAIINVRPMDLRRVFSVSGGVPLKQRAPQRQAYRLIELTRFRDYLGVPLTVEPRYFPGPGDEAPKLVIAADIVNGSDAALPLALALMRACWADEQNVDDEATRTEIVRKQGLDPAALAKGSLAVEVDKKYGAYTDEAIARGVFGAPSYFVDGVMYWGQDRLDFVDRALGK